MKPLGRQVLFELSGCRSGALARIETVRLAMLEAARRSRATVIDDLFHQFDPVGVSGVVVLSESHLAIHTWPEHGFAAVDLFTCRGNIDFRALERALVELFEAGRCESMEIERGSGVGPEDRPLASTL